MNKESQGSLQNKFDLDKALKQARAIGFRSDYKTDYRVLAANT